MIPKIIQFEGKREIQKNSMELRYFLKMNFTF